MYFEANRKHILVVLLCVLMLNSSPALADAMVTRSSGSATADYPAGLSLKDNAILKLRSGGRVTVKLKNAQRTFKGPGNFRIDRAARKYNISSLFKYVKSLFDPSKPTGHGVTRGSGEENEPNKTRPVTGINTAATENYCAISGSPTHLWRQDAAGMTTINIEEINTGKSASVRMEPGQAEVKWPDTFGSGAAGDFILSQSGSDDVLITIKNTSATEATKNPDLANIFFENECYGQLDALSFSIEEKTVAVSDSGPPANSSRPVDQPNAEACEIDNNGRIQVFAEKCSGTVLVIGNAYDNTAGWSQLANAVNDAKAISKIFPSQYEIITHENRNPTKEEILSLVDKFAASSAKSEVAIVYLSGHGFQHKGQAFYVPHFESGSITVQAVDQADIVKQFIAMDLFKHAMQGEKYNVMIADACRNNLPESIASSGRFSKLHYNIDDGSGAGTEAVFFGSSSPEGVAFDAAPEGSSPGPFAAELMRSLTAENVDIASHFTILTHAIKKRTAQFPDGPQKPYRSGSFSKFFYLTANQSAPEQATATRKTWKVDEEIFKFRDGKEIAVSVLRDFKVWEIEGFAESGNGDAAYVMSLLYYYGLGVPAIDKVEAKKWAESSVRLNSPAGMTMLGFLMKDGSEQELERAKQLYQRAADMGFFKAKTHMGALLSGTDNSDADKARGQALLLESANAGHLAGINWLFHGTDRKQEAYDAALKFAENGDGQIADWLCRTHNYRIPFWESVRNKSTAMFAACSKGAAESYAYSQTELSHMYLTGTGVAQNRDKAKYWFDRVSAVSDSHFVSEQFEIIKERENIDWPKDRMPQILELVSNNLSQ